MLVIFLSSINLVTSYQVATLQKITNLDSNDKSQKIVLRKERKILLTFILMQYLTILAAVIFLKLFFLLNFLASRIV